MVLNYLHPMQIMRQMLTTVSKIRVNKKVLFVALLEKVLCELLL